ncbi:MAG: RraA family protein [Pseudomonadota bacterium]|nr:RraA family protein [Pseudomonadota bacterium]
MAAKPPVLTVRREFPRPRAEHVERLAGAPVGHIVDAQGRVGALHHAIKPVTRAHRFAGAALTVDAGPRDNLAAWAALSVAKPGDVLVITTGGYEGAAVTGDLMVGMARNAGIVAVVTDGLVRDLDGLDAIGIPVFAAGVTPNSPQKNGPGRIGLPIVVGGVAVAPGDILCGDRDGVVVVAQDRAAEVVQGLDAIRDKEAAIEAAIRAGDREPAWLAETADLVAYVG